MPQKQMIRLSDLSKIVIGDTEVTATVTRTVLPSSTGSDGEKQSTADRWRETGESVELHVNLNDDQKEIRPNCWRRTISLITTTPRQPSPLLHWMPVLLMTGLLVMLFVFMMRRMGGAGSPMAFGRSRGKLDRPGRHRRHVRRRGRHRRGGRRAPRGRRVPQDAREVPAARRADSQGRAAGRPAGNRQDAAGQGRRRRGGRAVLQPQRLGLRRDVRRRRRGPRPRHVPAGRAEGAVHHLHRRARRPGQDPRQRQHRRPRRTRADAQRAAGRDGRLRHQQRRDRDGRHQPARNARPGPAAARAIRPPRAGRSARRRPAARRSSKSTCRTSRSTPTSTCRPWPRSPAASSGPTWPTWSTRRRCWPPARARQVVTMDDFNEAVERVQRRPGEEEPHHAGRREAPRRLPRGGPRPGRLRRCPTPTRSTRSRSFPAAWPPWATRCSGPSRTAS